MEQGLAILLPIETGRFTQVEYAVSQLHLSEQLQNFAISERNYGSQTLKTFSDLLFVLTALWKSARVDVTTSAQISADVSCR